MALGNLESETEILSRNFNANKHMDEKIERTKFWTKLEPLNNIVQKTISKYNKAVSILQFVQTGLGT